MPHRERAKVAQLPKKRSWCHCCGHRIREIKNGIRLLDHDYHRDCLTRAFAELNIHIELANMGLDQPPLPAA